MKQTTQVPPSICHRSSTSWKAPRRSPAGWRSRGDTPQFPHRACLDPRAHYQGWNKLGQVRSNVYRLAVCGDCFLELALVLERNAEVRMSRGQLGFKADRLAIGGDGSFEVALVSQRVAEVAM